MKPKEEIAWKEYRYKYLAKDDPNTVMYRLLFLAGYRAANQPFENMHVDSCTCEVCLNPRSASGIDSHLPGCTCGGVEGHHLLSCALRRPTPRALDGAKAAGK